MLDQRQHHVALVAVSIHAPRCREAMPGVDRLCVTLAEVSIHAPRCREAMLDSWGLDEPLSKFQSTPLVAERRCKAPKTEDCRDSLVSIHAPRCREAMLLAHPVEEFINYRFQSTPLVAERRCIKNKCTPDAGKSVSIHAPRCREAMQWQHRHRRHCRLGFNPRPSLPRGDAQFLRVDQQRRVVSIHAPRCREAMRCCRCCCGCREDSFNPRPSLPRGDAEAHRETKRKAEVSIHAPRCREAMRLVKTGTPLVKLFQSTPLVAERRCSSSGWPVSAWLSFNPRPSLPRGDAVNELAEAITTKVSIHAPRCREAMPPTSWRHSGLLLFQSTPLVAERRCASTY